LQILLVSCALVPAGSCCPATWPVRLSTSDSWSFSSCYRFECFDSLLLAILTSLSMVNRLLRHPI